MRLPSLDRDHWELESGEARHAANPAGFGIPSRAERDNLVRGMAARLIFRIAADRDGATIVSTERMWVLVSEVLGEFYIGLLTNRPACLEPEGQAYLLPYSEVPFRAEHVIDIDRPPDDYVRIVFREPPEAVWPRGEP